jgi:hypothetical protein
MRAQGTPNTKNKEKNREFIPRKSSVKAYARIEIIADKNRETV